MKHYLMLIAVLFSFAAFSQPNANSEIKDGTISGRVLDANLNEPLPYVNIIIKDKNQKVITGGITDAEGNFAIAKIPEGAVTVEITYIGYKTVSKSVTLEKGNYKVNLGDVKLSEDAAALDEVVVVAEVSTIQQKIDRKVVTVGKDLTTAGPTASDIMNNIPSVNMDAQTGAISLRGNANVQVMVDGKLSNVPVAQLLRQIPSTSIKQIELITNPSAKYNPEGMSGIINIILYKNVNIGFNGNLNVGLAYQIEPKFNSSIDANYRNGKLNYYGSYGNSFSDNVNEGIFQQQQTGNIQTLDILNENNSHLYKFGIDYYLNEKHTLSVFTNQNVFDGSAIVDTELSNTGNNNVQFQSILGDSENTSQQYNFNYKYDIADGHNIELEVDHNIFDSSSETDNLFSGNAQRPNFVEFTDNGRTRTTINLDYVYPFSESAKLEAGLQARIFENDLGYNSDGRVRNMMGNFVPTETDFTYSRDIFSVYASYGKQLEKWSYQLGLRAESVQVDAFAVDTDLSNNTSTDFPFENDYFQLYPSIFVNYKASEKNAYQFSVSRRVDRPGVGDVNPVPNFNTALISEFGNPELLPQFTNSAEFNFTRNLEKGSITAGVFYRIIEDEINQVVIVDRSDLTSGRVILTRGNFDTTNAYGFEVSSNYKVTKWWSLNASFDLYNQKQKGIAESIDPTLPNPTENDIVTSVTEVDNLIMNFRVFNNFKVTKRLSLSAFGFFRNKETGLNFEVDPIYFLNLGLRYSFLEDERATFSLNFNNVLDTQEVSVFSARPIPAQVNFEGEFKQIFAGLSYRFGGGKYRAKSRKNRDNDEKNDGGFF
ncbi:outer membrane receptor protein involved in Fe transport [Winogradskyella wandonensis]|uniref:Outer membrane receptor protein involved in Fe transport n=1 Tax=Winogradskyella wandonensis TaxID=1442586 RepID=A0A4R1KU48_9FLAO|nr:outer membrane beta-barrel protein [Winogradskyella wandonensis]TCK68728.1 outer membrane receptor protein involved in Fe transport [Winogradskyella wandonensis]